MAFQDFLLRARRPASLVAFNGALPSNFKLIHKPGSTWVAHAGVNIIQYDSLMLQDGDPPTLSLDVHYNLRVVGGPEFGEHAWSGWDGLFITDPSDPDFNDPVLNKSKLKRWMKNNGVDRLDDASEHLRSGQTMPWFRWEDLNGIDWLDITKRVPEFQRHTWLTL